MSLWNSFDPGYNGFNQYRNSQAKYFLPSEDEWYKAAYYNAGTFSYNLYPTGNTYPTPVASGTGVSTAVFNQSLSQGPAAVNQAGGASSYGTMGQGGNIWQWEESNYSGSNNDPLVSRGIRGGEWYGSALGLQSSTRLSNLFPNDERNVLGFRVASQAIPEPSTYALFGIGALALIVAYRRKVA